MSNPVEQSLVVQVAALSFGNVPEYRIAEELKISRYKVGQIRKSPEFAAHLKDIGDRAAQVALNNFKSKLEELEPLAYAALKANLEDKKLDAVKVWASMAGINDKDGNTVADVGGIQIIMPGAHVEKPAIEVESETE